MEKELVSIIMPSYNSAQFIGRSIDSVLAQNYNNWELLIQDDCSTDNTLDIIKEYAAKDKRIKYEVNPKNSGAAITRNNAIARAKGVWLAYLDSDDLWVPNKLEKQLRFMNEKQCSACFSRYEHIDTEGNSLGVQAKVKKKVSHTDLLIHDWFGCLTLIYKQDLNHKIYGADVSKANDYALFLEVMKNIDYAAGLDECLAMYRIRKGSVSRNKFKKAKPYIHVLQTVEKKNVLMSWFLLGTHMFVKTFFKYKKVSQEESIVNNK